VWKQKWKSVPVEEQPDKGQYRCKDGYRLPLRCETIAQKPYSGNDKNHQQNNPEDQSNTVGDTVSQ
jgi:hypothetical protein